MPRSRHADLTIAVIHYQTPALLQECIGRLRRAAPQAQIIVVDTGDRAPLPPAWPAAHEGVRILRHPNHSYAAAVNAALRSCTTSRFAQLNADVLVEPETFDDLAAALAEADAAMAGPLARDAHGRLQRQGLPYRLHQWRARASTKRRRAGGASPRSGERGASGASATASPGARRASATSSGDVAADDPPGWVDAPWLSGCLQYLRREVADVVGGMDSSLRFYNEDLEWCLRLRAAGFRCILVDSKVIHVGGSSTPPSAPFLVEGLRGGYLLTRRYRGRPARLLHRTVVASGALILSYLDPRPTKREAYRQVATMFRLGRFDESPFGPTLSTSNPAFRPRGVS